MASDLKSKNLINIYTNYVETAGTFLDGVLDEKFKKRKESSAVLWDFLIRVFYRVLFCLALLEILLSENYYVQKCCVR